MTKLRRALLILAAILLIVLIFGLIIAQDQETLRIRSAVAAEDPASVAYVADLVGAPVTGGNVYDVLTNGDESFRGCSARLVAPNAASTSRRISTTRVRSRTPSRRRSMIQTNLWGFGGDGAKLSSCQSLADRWTSLVVAGGNIFTAACMFNV